MPKRVTMVAEIIGDNCTGCRLCEQVCATVAITMRPRTDEEIGPGKNIAVMHDEHCYNIQSCLEICPDDAIVMRQLDEPFDVSIDVDSVDPQELSALCRKANLPPNMMVCPCTNTKAAELAAAVLQGASTPDELSRMTGVRTGCSELCYQPIFDMLAAAGHSADKGMKRNPPTGFQWYGRPDNLFDQLQEDGTFSREFEEQFALYQPTRELAELMEARKASSEKRKKP